MKRILLSLGCVVALAGCRTPGPAVDSVWAKTRIMTVSAAEESAFLSDRASGLRTEGKFLSPDKQGEEFAATWHGAGIELVKFEYRQLNAPDKIFVQQYRPQSERSHVFAVIGDAYRQGGMVSSWRVSLWSGDQKLAEKKSSLW